MTELIPNRSRSSTNLWVPRCRARTRRHARLSCRVKSGNYRPTTTPTLFSVGDTTTLVTRCGGDDDWCNQARYTTNVSTLWEAARVVAESWIRYRPCGIGRREPGAHRLLCPGSHGPRPLVSVRYG
jgi:hypothetical protein